MWQVIKMAIYSSLSPPLCPTVHVPRSFHQETESLCVLLNLCLDFCDSQMGHRILGHGPYSLLVGFYESLLVFMRGIMD